MRPPACRPPALLSGAFSPGLIEACRAQPQSRWLSASLSGAFSPGLIEAASRPTLTSGRTSLSGAFSPGLIEAHRRRGRGTKRGLLSGAFSPGLIEACWRALTSRCSALRYPGHSAPASLKPRAAKSACAAARGYPGHSAPASLKLPPVDTVVSTLSPVIRGIQPRPH